MAENPMTGLDARNPAKPGTRSFAITPSDSVDLPTGTRMIWVGGTGTLKVSLVDDNAAHTGQTLTAVPAGVMINIAARKVYATGTSATLLIGFA